MKKGIRNLCILSLVLAIVSATIILLFGRTYTLKYNISNKNEYTLTIENNTGEVEVLEEYSEGEYYVVKIKSKSPGTVYISLGGEDVQESRVFFIHKSMIITDNNFFGASTFCEVIPISLSIILIYILYSLIRKYTESKKENLYQYKNIAYLGIIIFISFFTLSNILSIFRYQGLFDTVGKVIGSISFVSYILYPVALVTFVIVTISNIILIKKEGRSFNNMLGVFLGIFICAATLFPDFMYKMLLESQKINIFDLNSIGPYLYNFVESLIYLVIAYLECILIGTIIIAIKAVRKKVELNKDYVIILGCQIRKDGSLTPLLKGRVDRAIRLRNEQLELTGKDLKFIPSGGKGKDEVISEAEAIKNYLIEEGIKEKNIIIEDKSKNTYENIRNSNKLIKKENVSIAFSTTNYHVLRAGLIATEQGLKIEGVGSSTKSYFWINAFIREFIGTIYSERKKHILVFCIVALLIILMVTITYFANNIRL